MAASEKPFIIQMAYAFGMPNEKVVLYSGGITVTQEMVADRVPSGVISVDWLPRPRVRLDLSNPEGGGALTPGDARVTADDLGVSADIWISRVSARLGGENAGMSVDGELVQPLVVGQSDVLRRVIFHVLNYHDLFTPSLSFESSKWRVRLERRADHKLVFDALRSSGGYAVTHVGMIEKVDASAISIEEADDVLEALSTFLTLTRGLRCGPILPVGFNGAGARTWERWSIWDVDDAARTVESWISTWSPNSLSELFPGFMAKWDDPLWQEPLRIAIHWYAEANKQAASLEGALVLAQVALELLAWVKFVENDGEDAEKFDKKKAATKLRLLLQASSVPLAIPGELKELSAYAAKPGWPDGPEAFTEMRNGVVHPKRRQNASGASARALIEAWKLGLWYLELGILWICGYQHVYSNRLVEGRSAAAVERVPWASGPGR